MSRLVRSLTNAEERTDPAAEDPRLRGRTYAIPFERVWRAAVALADGGLMRWSLTAADDMAGVIHAQWTTFPLRRISDVRIEIRLDANAQTRVDVRARSRGGRGDLGANARAIGFFLRRLDRALQAGPAHVLDATRVPSRSA